MSELLADLTKENEDLRNQVQRLKEIGVVARKKGSAEGGSQTARYTTEPSHIRDSEELIVVRFIFSYLGQQVNVGTHYECT